MTSAITIMFSKRRIMRPPMPPVPLRRTGTVRRLSRFLRPAALHPADLLAIRNRSGKFAPIGRPLQLTACITMVDTVLLSRRGNTHEESKEAAAAGWAGEPTNDNHED